LLFTEATLFSYRAPGWGVLLSLPGWQSNPGSQAGDVGKPEALSSNPGNNTHTHTHTHTQTPPKPKTIPGPHPC
jgi:hypothetical protein